MKIYLNTVPVSAANTASVKSIANLKNRYNIHIAIGFHYFFHMLSLYQWSDVLEIMSD